MGLFSIVFLICLLLGLYIGWRNGWLKTLIRLLSFLGAYALLYLYLKPFSTYLGEVTELGFLFSNLLAGGALLGLGGFAISLCLRILVALIKLLLPWKAPTEEKPPSSAKDPFGAVVGGGLGSIFALFLIWAMSLLSSELPQLTPKPNHQWDLRLSNLAKSMVGGLSGRALQLAGAETQDQALVQAIMRDPLSNAKRLRSIGESSAFRELLQDKDSVQLMRSGNSEALLKDKKFQAVMQQPEMQDLVKESGLADQAGGEQALAKTVGSAFSRMESLRNNPKIMQIMQDPELQKQIKNKDYFALFSNPKFEQILEAFQNAPAPKSEASNSETEQKASYPEPSDKVYHWVDDEGNHHYSDQKPD